MMDDDVITWMYKDNKWLIIHLVKIANTRLFQIRKAFVEISPLRGTGLSYGGSGLDVVSG